VSVIWRREFPHFDLGDFLTTGLLRWLIVTIGALVVAPAEATPQPCALRVAQIRKRTQKLMRRA